MTVARLFDEQDRRLFFNLEERIAFFEAANRATNTTRIFCQLIHYTGCNISEAQNLTPLDFDFAAKTVIVKSTTPRTHDITRAIPLPDAFIALLNEVYDIQRDQQSEGRNERIWPY